MAKDAPNVDIVPAAVVLADPKVGAVPKLLPLVFTGEMLKVLALLDVPKIDAGAKAVADEVPNRPPPADVVVAVPREPNPTLATVETGPKALVVLVALPNMPPETEVDEPSVVDE